MRRLLDVIEHERRLGDDHRREAQETTGGGTSFVPSRIVMPGIDLETVEHRFSVREVPDGEAVILQVGLDDLPVHRIVIDENQSVPLLPGFGNPYDFRTC